MGCRCTLALAALAALAAIAGGARAADPAVEWKRSDWYPEHPTSGSQTQEESGEDWWLDHKTSRDGQSAVNGFIAAGYSSFVNYTNSEFGLDGCLHAAPGAPACWLLETPGNVRGSVLAAMALVAPDGESLVWHHTYNEGWFNRVIQTSDGGYLAVGATAATRAASFAPLYYNPNQTSGNTTDQFDAGVACTIGDNVRHIVVVKTDADGLVEWEYLYGIVPYSAGASAAYEAASEAFNAIEQPGGGYRIVGHAVDPSFTYSCNGTQPLTRAFMIEVASNGHFVAGSFAGPTTLPSVITGIARYGSGAGLRYLTSGMGYFVGSIPNPYTGCNLFQQAFAAQSDGAGTVDWVRSDFDVSTTASQRTDDIQVSVRNGTTEVLFPLIVNCEGCLYANYNSGRGKVYRLDTAAGAPIGAAMDLGTLTAFDLKLRLSPTEDGGFAVASSKLVDPPPAPYSCYDTRYWNTDAFVARYDADGIQEWETTFDVDGQPADPYPGDLKKQECITSISEDADGGFVVGGNNSFNFDDSYLTKVGYCTPPPAQMVSWWADCDPNDRIGPNDGAAQGTPFCPAESRVGGQALGFDTETLTFVRVDDHPSFGAFAGNFTIDAWIKTEPGSPIMQKGYAGGPGFFLSVDFNGRLSFAACDVSASCFGPMLGNAVVGDGAWHHVAVTVDDSTVTLYVDGTLDASAPFPLGSLVSSQVMLIGASGPLGVVITDVFDGLMDEIEIFSRALTPAEIAAIHGSGSAGKCKCTEPPEDMLAWWPLDSAVGASAEDLAGNNDATYVDSPAYEADGKVAGARRLDPGHLEAPGAPFDFGTSDFTIDAWVKFTSGESTGEFWIVNRGFDFHFAAGWPVASSNPHLRYECGLAPWPEPIPYDTWTHLAVTVQRDTPGGLKKYVNGRLVGTQNACAYTISYPGVPLGIGGSGSGSQHVADEVEIFTRALAPDEILAIYEARSAGKCKPGTGGFGVQVPSLEGWKLGVLVALMSLVGAGVLRRSASIQRRTDA
jgi:hypothetical protein